jgi:hypothetical protein
MNSKKSSTSIKDFLKKFRNHLRSAWTLITKKAIHEIFVTLQNKTQNKDMINQKLKKNRESKNRKSFLFMW